MTKDSLNKNFKQVKILFDSGDTSSFISKNMVKYIGLRVFEETLLIVVIFFLGKIYTCSRNF